MVDGGSQEAQGRNVLRRLLRGKPPRSNMEWPPPAGVGELPPTFALPIGAGDLPPSRATPDPPSIDPALFGLNPEGPSAVGAGLHLPDGEIRFQSFPGPQLLERLG